MSKNFQNSAASLSETQAQFLAQTLLQQAQAFHQKGQLAQARSLYESLLKVQPRNFDGLQLFGSLAYQTGEHLLAIELISRAITINPKLASLYINIGLALQALGRFDEALASYDKAISLEPNFVTAHNHRGNALNHLHRPHDALISYDHAIAHKPDSAEAYNGRGVALAELKQLDEALLSYDKAIALKPDCAEALNNRAAALNVLERWKDALADCEKAIELKSDYAEAHYNRANSLQALQRIDEAMSSYDKAIALKPYYPEAYYQRAKALQTLERIDEALISYDKAIALKPDYTEAHNDRDAILTERKRLDEAPPLMERAAPSSRSARAMKPTSGYKIPIPPGFERHYADYQYAHSHFADKNVIAIDGHEVRILDRISEPEIVIFENVLSDIECELLIELSRPKLQPTPTFDRENASSKGKLSVERTSEGMGFLRGANALIRTIETRLAKLMNLPPENGEELNILHYVTGAEYRPHYDFMAPEDKNSAFYMQQGGQRVATLIMYLNDVESGGETIFPEIDFSVTPRKGSAVLFSYCDASGKLDRLSLHGGAPVTRGEKWIATKWVRQQAYKVRY